MMRCVLVVDRSMLCSGLIEDEEDEACIPQVCVSEKRRSRENEKQTTRIFRGRHSTYDSV